MIEGQHFIEEKHAGVGDVQLILGQRGQALDLAHRVISKVADSARREGRQSLAGARACGHSARRAEPQRCRLQYGVVLRPSVMAISRPRATMRLNGVRPMKV